MQRVTWSVSSGPVTTFTGPTWIPYPRRLSDAIERAYRDGRPSVTIWVSHTIDFDMMERTCDTDCMQRQVVRIVDDAPPNPADSPPIRPPQ